MDNLQMVHTSVAGVNSGNMDVERQLALSLLKKHQDEKKLIIAVDLVPEPENDYDPNAIRVMVDLADLGGPFQLGYIRNRPSCNYCAKEFTRKSLKPGDTCPNCHRADIDRVGLATRLSQEMNNGATFRAEIAQVTGGTDGKNIFGCNLVIRKV